VFHIAGRAESSSSINKSVVTYRTGLDDEYLRYAVKSVMPDVIIFAGAFDERYFWRDYERCSSRYMSDLTNVLISASEMGVKKIIYLSTVNVYGFNNEGTITEETPLAPGNVKSIIVAQGEKICSEMCASGRIDTISLRFGMVYGGTTYGDASSDYILNKCITAIVDRKMTVNNLVMPIITAQDAAIAVYKAIYLEGENGAYNVCDNETISDATISDIILEQYNNDGYEIELLSDDRFKRQEHVIDGSKFNEAYSFFQKTNYKEGILSTANYVRDNEYRFKKKDEKLKPKEKKNAWYYVKFLAGKFRPFIENLLLFAVFQVLISQMSSFLNLQSIDLLILYVIIMAITFGKQQAIASIVIILLYKLFSALFAGNAWIDIFVDYVFLANVMFYFIIGTIVGHVRDVMSQKIAQSTERIEYVEAEHRKLNEINDVTIAVKNTLEERLISQSDSLANVYGMIEQVDSLMPPKTYLESLDVISRFLKSKSICIYLKSKQKNEYNLAYWTDERAGRLGEHINILNYVDIAEAFSNHNIYINKALNPDLPLLSAAITANDRTESIVMVWDIQFEAVTMYHVNLFVTIAKIIESSIGRARNYRVSLERLFSVKYEYDNTQAYLLPKKEFLEVVNTAKEAKNRYNIPYSVVDVNLENMTLKDVVSELKPILGESSYLYLEGKSLKVLFNHTDGNHIKDFIRQYILGQNETNNNRLFTVTEMKANPEG
jgi:nucleoside-diphosphate-sugar epimerase